MSTGSWELIATDESTVIAKPVLDVIVVQDGESDGCFPNAPCAYEGYGFEVVGETKELLDKLVASETGPGCRGRQFSWRNTV